MTHPLVSIGIPTVRRLGYLREAVESALGQSWQHVEVLVGDNGTTTETPDWCRARAEQDPRLLYHRNPRDLGMAGNWNAIADRASGEFLVLIGDDDRLLPDFVTTLLAARTEQSAVIFCNHDVIDTDGRRLDEPTRRATVDYHRDGLAPGLVPNAEIAAWQMAVWMSAALVRRRDVVRLRFHEELNSPDIEFLIRLASEGHRFDFVPEYLAEYRAHAGSMTATGLRNDTLAACLLRIPASPDAEPYKRALLEHLLVNAASRCMRDSDWAGARRFLANDYYPRIAQKWPYLLQHTFTRLPVGLGAPLYRTLLRLKLAARR